MDKKLFMVNWTIFQCSLIKIKVGEKPNQKAQLILTVNIPYLIQFNINADVEMIMFTARFFNFAEVFIGLGS